MNKLETLAEQFGYDEVGAMLDAYWTDSTVPAICMETGCDYSTLMEPDQRAGWCESCEYNTVKSALVLMGLI